MACMSCSGSDGVGEGEGGTISSGSEGGLRGRRGRDDFLVLDVWPTTAVLI